MEQRYWQMLPCGPTGYGDSPYQTLSSFAGHPLWISFDDLLEDGLLEADELSGFPVFPDRTVDFGPVIAARAALLRRAAARFAARADTPLWREFAEFKVRHADWLEDYALFAALKETHGDRPWHEWPAPLAAREPSALQTARRELADLVEAQRVWQFLFARQWQALRAAARAAGVNIIGDLPIFCAHDSADVWTRPELFALDATGRPTVVAGVPPDYFSATGQRWGNPLYRWERHAEEGYAWWIARLNAALAHVDEVRLDHFRGFEAYWEIPAGEPTAVNGRWAPGPGAPFFAAARAALGELPIIAENLGVITPPVEALRKQFDLPGMLVLQFRFADLLRLPGHRPEDCPPDTVLYTGTHDNDTAIGSYTQPAGADDTRAAAVCAAERAALRRYLGTSGWEIHWDLIRLALRSPARRVILPLQDPLGLGHAARMNTPGRAGGNWRWRFTWPELNDTVADRLRAETTAAGRG